MAYHASTPLSRLNRTIDTTISQNKNRKSISEAPYSNINREQTIAD